MTARAEQRQAEPGAAHAILAGLRRGEPVALDHAFALYRERLFRFLHRLCGQRDLAEDLLQETFLQLARSALRLAEDTELGAWLFTVARNAWRMQARRNSTSVRLLSALPPPEAPPAANPERAALAGDAVARLQLALASLDADQREVLLLAAEGEFPSDTMAAMLGLRPEAFRKRLERARDELARRLGADLSPATRGKSR